MVTLAQNFHPGRGQNQNPYQLTLSLTFIGESKHQTEESGAKHKIKEKEKSFDVVSQGKASTDVKQAASAKGEAASKDKKQKQPVKDEHGIELKRPQTAYMLFNNYRRPVLRSEHPGKSNTSS